MRVALAALGTAILLGCSDDETASKNPPPGGPTPTISITSPTEGATVDAELEMEGTEPELVTEIEFNVANFSLKEPGKCAGATGCGHVFIKVDGDECNDTEEDGEVLPYNEKAWASPADADFLYCPGVTLGPDGAMGAEGTHAISLELHNDDGTAVKDASGQVVHASVNVTVELEAAGGAGGGGGGAGGSAGGAGGKGGAGGSTGGAGGSAGGAGGKGGAGGAGGA